MDNTSIKLLKSLIGGQKDAIELLNMLGIKDRRLAYIIKNLVEEGYIEKEGAIIKLKETSKATLFRDITQIVDVEKLLRESNEIILSNIDENTTIDQLVKKSGLSKATTYRAISDLQSIGAILKNEDVVNIDKSKEQLVLFTKLLKTEKEKKYEDGSTEIIYNNNSTILRKTPSGKIAKGVTTGLTLFSDYEIEYKTTHDYFCEQKKDLEIQDVLLHAVYSANYSKNKMELLIAIVFYAKHKDKMDVLQLRKKASELGVSEIWLDIEAYIRRKQLKNTDLFLPWDEFLSKAKLYDIPIEKYPLPEPSNLLFRGISDELQESKTIYLFGGENMRIKSLKDSTKDCDMVVENKVDFDDLAEILTDMGYERRLKTNYSDEDRRIKPDDIFEHEKKSRIDLFTTTIMQDLSLSSTMKEKADIRDYGKLKVGLLKNEHVFLLKAIANREGDIQDMAALVTGSPNTPHELQHGPFDWELVWNEILRQEHINHTRDFTTIIFEQISYLAEQTRIVAPFLDKLRRHVIDRIIKRILHGGSMTIKEIVRWLNGGDITEPMIRNRIDALEKAENIAKYSAGRTTYIKLLKNNEYSEKELKINSHRLKIYLDWRFFIRQKESDQHIQELVEELEELGFQTIGELDEIVRNSTETLKQYESEHFSKRHFDIVGATRICVGLHYPEIGQKRSSKYFLSQFKKYNEIARGKFIPEHRIKMVR